MFNKTKERQSEFGERQTGNVYTNKSKCKGNNRFICVYVIKCGRFDFLCDFVIMQKAPSISSFPIRKKQNKNNKCYAMAGT